MKLLISAIQNLFGLYSQYFIDLFYYVLYYFMFLWICMICMYACDIHCTDNELLIMFIYYTIAWKIDHDQLLSLLLLITQ